MAVWFFFLKPLIVRGRECILMPSFHVHFVPSTHVCSSRCCTQDKFQCSIFTCASSINLPTCAILGPTQAQQRAVYACSIGGDPQRDEQGLNHGECVNMMSVIASFFHYFDEQNDLSNRLCLLSTSLFVVVFYLCVCGSVCISLFISQIYMNTPIHFYFF
jgi:hypothetical protein